MPLYLTDDKSTLVQVPEQAITRTSVDQDLQRHMASLVPNELSYLCLLWKATFYDFMHYIMSRVVLQWSPELPMNLLLFSVNYVFEYEFTPWPECV